LKRNIQQGRCSSIVQGGEEFRKGLLPAGMESVLEDFQILCVLWRRIHHRTHGCKWSLLKVREGKRKREHGGHRHLQEERKRMLLFSRCF
jgi:hypothetical protein